MEQPLNPSGFVILRTPLLPFDELLRWSEGLEAPEAGGDPARLERALASDRTRLRARLDKVFRDSEIREALFLSAPHLEAGLEIWRQHPTSRKGSGVERSLVGYYTRMMTRPTPFGLFAGASLGENGARTRLRLCGHADYKRLSRLDIGFLRKLCHELAKDPLFFPELLLRPNSSLYRAGGTLRYLEVLAAAPGLSYQLVSTESTETLEAILAVASRGARRSELEDALHAVVPEATPEEVSEFLAELVACQLLVPELEPPLTGPDPLSILLEELRGLSGAATIVQKLETAKCLLQQIDSGVRTQAGGSYRTIAEQLQGLPTKRDFAHMFHVELTKPAADFSLGPASIPEILAGVEALRRIGRPGKNKLIEEFKQRFLKYYGHRSVPLGEVLDPELGIGLGPAGNSGGDEPLLADIPIPERDESSKIQWGHRERLLLRKLNEAWIDNRHEIELEVEDLEALPQEPSSSLPDAFSVLVTLCAASDKAIDDGQFQIVIRNWAGPSGASLTARLGGGSEPWLTNCRKHIRAEERLEPDAVFTEIVHLPFFENRAGNVIHRPLLRNYEIPYFGRSGAPLERQIPLDDLLVAVESDEVVLRSGRLGKKIIPRLSCAHSFHNPRNLPVYRFLASLQRQKHYCEGQWSWRPFSSAPFLPRVRYGRVVLSPARWQLQSEEIRKVTGDRSDTARYRRVQELRLARHLPRWIELEGMLIDLDNVLSVGNFIHMLGKLDRATLLELFPGPDQLCVSSPDGSFSHDLFVPVVRNRLPTKPQKKPANSLLCEADRRFPPGSEWLSLKLYSSRAMADTLLVGPVAEVAARATHAGNATRWYFLRYSDPDWHLRVRFYGKPKLLIEEVLPDLHSTLLPFLDSGKLRRFELDTYGREIERYGGVEGVRLAERIFHADSDAILGLLASDTGTERWHLALLGIDRLLTDFGFDLDAKVNISKRLQSDYRRQFKPEGRLRQALARKLRREREGLRRLLDRGYPGGPTAGDVVLDRRSAALAPVVEDLYTCVANGTLMADVTDLALSYVHMHVNRILVSEHLAQEMVLYDFLYRFYCSQMLFQDPSEE